MTFYRRPLGLKPTPPTATEKTAGRLHLAKVASLPCVICGVSPVECHHVICGRYSQRRAPDTHTIPLCYLHHRGAEGIHTRREWWVQTYGPDTDYLSVVQDMLAGQFNSPWRDG